MLEQVIIIPSYQPSESLILFIKNLADCFNKIIVVDDGSGSGYNDIFQKIENIAEITVLRHAINQGKGRAIKTAFNYCLNCNSFCGRGVITVDGDGQHAIDDIKKIAVVLSDSDENSVVLGAREFDKKHVPFRSRFGNNVSRIVYRYACGINVTDTQTGLRGFHYSQIPLMLSVEGERYEYETNILISLKDNAYKIIEIPIQTIYEEGNKSSHFNPITDSIKIYRMVLKYSAASVLSLLIDYGVFVILVLWETSIIRATYIARACSSIANFLINRSVVFRNKGDIRFQFIKYILLAVASATVSGVIVNLLYSYAGIYPAVCKIVVDTVLFFLNYYIQRKFVFTKEEE